MGWEHLGTGSLALLASGAVLQPLMRPCLSTLGGELQARVRTTGCGPDHGSRGNSFLLSSLGLGFLTGETNKLAKSCKA